MKRIIHSYLDSYRGLSTPTWMLAIVMLINRTGAMVLPFLGIYMTTVLGYNLKQAGVVLSCFGVGAVSGSIAGGWLTDKFGHFKVQTSSLFLAVPVFLTLPFLSNIYVLSAGVFSLSLVTEIFRPANSVSISLYAKPGNITRAFSLNRMALNLGFSIGPALGGFFAAISYHLLFYGNAFSSCMAGIVFFIYFNRLHKEKKFKSQAASADIKKSKQGISPWKDPVFLMFSLLVCFYSLCFFQLLNTLPLYYKNIGHLKNSDIGLLLGFNGLVVFCLEMFLVSTSERIFSTARTIILGTILGGLSFLVLLTGSHLSLLYLAMFLLSVSEILTMPFIATVAIRRAPAGREGAYMGLNALSFSSAHILSPLAGTFIAAHFGFPSLWLVSAIWALLTATGFWWVMKKIR